MIGQKKEYEVDLEKVINELVNFISESKHSKSEY